MNYPGNSKNKREVVKVVKGVVGERKKPLLEAARENLSPLKDYIFNDVLVPAFKSTITEIVTNAIEMVLYGETRPKKRDSRSYVNYNSISKPVGRERHSRNTQLRFDDITFETKSDAEQVLANMVELVDQYGLATMADFYDLAGINSDWTDNKYGWTSLGRAAVLRVKGGYIVDLPRAEKLE